MQTLKNKSLNRIIPFEKLERYFDRINKLGAGIVRRDIDYFVRTGYGVKVNQKMNQQVMGYTGEVAVYEYLKLQRRITRATQPNLEKWQTRFQQVERADLKFETEDDTYSVSVKTTRLPWTYWAEVEYLNGNTFEINPGEEYSWMVQKSETEALQGKQNYLIILNKMKPDGIELKYVLKYEDIFPHLTHSFSQRGNAFALWERDVISLIAGKQQKQ